ncbi:MAG: type II secretion system F family protein [Anaerolineae bacterium]|nr:type II secretion system F family protein [Anaerolineae bacterium]HXK42534.1 type II secretion system F family protein [Anaerolineae bacterium]
MTWFFVLIGIAEAMLLVFSLRGRREGEDLVKDRVGSRREKKERAEKSEGPSKLGKAVDRAVAGRGFANTLADQLARADLKLTVGEYLIISVTVGLGAALLFYILNRAILIPVGLIVGFLGPRIYLSQRQSSRLKAFDAQLGDALNLMVNSLRAGYSTLQAMDVISKEMPEPISKEFGRVVMELQLGVDFDTAMQHLIRRMPSPDLDLMITAMSVQREVGGNLAEVLDAISFTIRERVRIKGEIKVLIAQGQLTGYLLTFLPFGLAAFLYMYNPDFMGPMFTDPCGWLMLGISVVLIAVGYFVINKIISIEV